MSYGIWKKRGKGWSSFELDGCDDWKWQRMPEARRNYLLRKAREAGLNGASYHDPAFVVWYVGQRDRGRVVVGVDTKSDHALWIAYADDQARAAAAAANGYGEAALAARL